MDELNPATEEVTPTEQTGGEMGEVLNLLRDMQGLLANVQTALDALAPVEAAAEPPAEEEMLEGEQLEEPAAEEEKPAVEDVEEADALLHE